MMRIILRLYAAYGDGIFAAFNPVTLQCRAAELVGKFLPHTVAAVCYEFRRTPVSRAYIILYTFIVGHNRIGIPYRHRLRTAQYPLGKPAPLVATMFQPVDVHHNPATGDSSRIPARTDIRTLQE